MTHLNEHEGILHRCKHPTTRDTCLLILVALCFYATSIRDGHDWGGDYSQYILHAKTLIEGRDYTDLGYVYKPEVPIGPRAYPPGYPAALAPVLYFFGLDFVALKAVTLLFVGAALLAYWHLARTMLPRQWAFGSVMFLAFSPWLLKFSNLVLSDISYLAVSLGSVLTIHQFLARPAEWKRAVAVVLSIVLACSFRTAGIVLIGSLGAYVILFRRSHLYWAGGVTAASLAGVALIDRVFECGSTYLEHPSFSPLDIVQNILTNLPIYKRGLLLYLAPYPADNESTLFYILINNAALLLYLGLVGLGAWRYWKKRGIQFHDVYVATYIAVILCYLFAQKTRYLLPVIPILSLYAFLGLRTVMAKLRVHRIVNRLWSPQLLPFRKLKAMGPVALYVPLFLACWGYYSLYPPSVGANILRDPHVVDLLETLRERRADISGAIFDHPRVLRLFTDVRTATCQTTDRLEWDFDKVIDFSRERGFSHVVIGPQDRTLGPIIEQNPGAFEAVYSNPKYTIYQMSQHSRAVTWQTTSKDRS